MHTHAEKLQLLKTAEPRTDDFANRVFFAARNLAIDAMLRRLEVLLLREGFPAECAWRESSNNAPIVEISMLNPKPTEGSWEAGTCQLYLNRERMAAPEALSNAVFSIKSFCATQYWRAKQPAKLLAFRARVQELHDSGHLAAEVQKLNYPFDYPSNSSY